MPDQQTIELLQNGGMIVLLIFAVWFLNKRNDKLMETNRSANERIFKEIKDRQDECEKDRGALHEEAKSLHRELGALREAIACLRKSEESVITTTTITEQ